MPKLLPRWSNFRRYCDGGKTSARAVLNAFVIFCLTGIYVDTHWRLPFITSCEPRIKLTPAMAMRTLPLLYLNLGGEMMYVLDQRLVAQKIPGSKASKGSLKIKNLLRTEIMFLTSVLDDIASTMFNRKFIEEIFLKHQALQSRRVLRAMFDKLAHASIMRLNSSSMDKVTVPTMHANLRVSSQLSIVDKGTLVI